LIVITESFPGDIESFCSARGRDRENDFCVDHISLAGKLPVIIGQESFV